MKEENLFGADHAEILDQLKVWYHYPGNNGMSAEGLKHTSIIIRFAFLKRSPWLQLGK